MSETIQDLYQSFAAQMEPIQEDDRYFQYLYELAQSADTTVEQKREELERVIDQEWLDVIEDSLDAINAVVANPRRFITTEEEVVPTSLAKRISADSVRHLSQNTQYLVPSNDGEIHPTHVLNVTTAETYDLYENRFVYHLIQRLLAFVDKRTDAIFWSNGNEICHRLQLHTKVADAYEEVECTVQMSVKNRQSFAENDADNVEVFRRIDRVRRLVSSLRSTSFCKMMKDCSVVRSPIQRTNLITKDPNYRTCYQLWQFMERYDEIGYTVNITDSELPVDDEYLVQMHTNLINSYTVFKSLTADERILSEAEVEQREPVKPKFVKELKEVLVADPDLPDVEIRRVFVEEVTQAQLDAEAALESERQESERLRAAIEQLAAEKDALSQERDAAEQAVAAANKELAASEQRAVQLQHQANAEIAAAQRRAEEGIAAAKADAERRVSDVRAESEARIASINAEAELRVADANAAAEERAAADKSRLEQAAADLLALREASAEELKAANEASLHEVERVRSLAAKELAEALDASRKEKEAELSRVERQMEKRIASLLRDLSKMEKQRDRAKKQAEANSLSHYLLAKLRGSDGSSEEGGNNGRDGSNREGEGKGQGGSSSDDDGKGQGGSR